MCLFHFFYFFLGEIDSRFYLFIIMLYNIQTKQCILFLLCNTSMGKSSFNTSQRVYTQKKKRMKTFTNQNNIFKFFRDLPQLSITSRESIFNTNMRCQRMFRVKQRGSSRRIQLGPVSLVITTHQVNVTMPYSQFSLTFTTGLFALLGRATSGVGLFTRLLLLLLLALWKEQQKNKIVVYPIGLQLQINGYSFKSPI